ncbi:S9 family peptidase [Candidatus Aminicenantes bacterium AC-334-K16]|nr:S9 family peptidase [Candidatus Aminicenantes bacterium AC-334-K16]
MSELAISSDGERAALLFRQIKAPTDDYRRWIEIYDLKQPKLLQAISPVGTISQIKWSPRGHRLAYLLQEKAATSLRIHELPTGKIITPLKEIKNLRTYFWFPDGESILYVTSKKEKPAQKGLLRFRHLADRLPESRQKLSFFRLNLSTNDRQPLLLDSPATSVEGLSPNGQKLLLAQTVVKETERPFAETKLYLLDLNSLRVEKIWQGKWFTRALWAPDARQLIILGGPSLAGSLGQNVPRELIPNEYDTQAYLFDLSTKKFTPLTRDFDPSINNAFWSPADNNIYFVATEKSYRRLFRLNPQSKKIHPLHLPVEVIEKFSLAATKPVALWLGSSTNIPQKVYVTYLEKGQTTLLCFPGEEFFKQVKLGKVEDWNFRNKKGRVIQGRVYYPPDFDPSQRYPCLVYYYGGTMPTTREFGGRYPKNLYAAHGYVVYVLQPSGAVGFGQAFSALHVNDWGQIVAQEIITGVKKFLASHPFVDPSRVGCLGASFGGFMTMSLLTKTNIFAAAMAHAGISLIPSYWGEGYWGYAYSAIATANSYPWNRKDIYVERSPLFKADKITTPLLLLHGSVDTNVPPGESTQLFTALRILGRKVEYIQVKGQNHHILAYNQRILWTQTILAWFDKWLKKQPEWWNHLYPSP